MALHFPTESRLLRITTFLVFAFNLILISCDQQNKAPEQPNEAIVAKVGERSITAKEFRNNYEVGFAHLKTESDPKKTYLEYIIKEKLIALEGYRVGFDQSAYVRNNEQRLLNDLMIEALLEKEVKSKLKITPAEIRNEINKSNVSFKFRYWIEPTLEKARLIAVDMRERGYAEVMDDIIHSNPERKINPKRYETDYLTYLEVPAEVLNAIKDLPYGDISDPLKINDKYFLFQVLDIRRKAITENEYKARASTFEQIIFYRKYKEAVNNYTAELMQSKNVVTKGGAFSLLARALQEWLKINPENRGHFPQKVTHATDDQSAMRALKDNLHSTFFTYRDEHLSISEFLTFLNESRLLRQLNEINDFGDALRQEVKNAIRDYFFVKKAEKLHLQNSPEVLRELNLWRDKWIYNETRRNLIGELELSDKQVRHYFTKNKNRYRTSKDDEPDYASNKLRVEQDAYRHQMNLILERKVELLKERYPVVINRTVLDTITITDFEKSRWQNMQVFKAGTNRPALPVVDPLWE